MTSPLVTTVPVNTCLPQKQRRRVLFAVVRALLGVFPPFTLNRVRLWALRCCGVRPGVATLFWGFPRLIGCGMPKTHLHVGSYCGFNDGCVFDLSASITIGNHVSVGHEVHFDTAHRYDGTDVAASITIEDGVWLGTRCRIMGGVTIGAGTVIGAGVTVAADVPPNTLMTGAKPISLAKWR